jgi:hypothetical protein
MAIYIKQGSSLIEMTTRPYDAEEVLQQLLADHPNLLVGEQDGDRRKRWLLVQREIAIGDEPDASSRWSLDHPFLDEDGVPTLVEVKRSSDTRIVARSWARCSTTQRTRRDTGRSTASAGPTKRPAADAPSVVRRRAERCQWDGCRYRFLPYAASPRRGGQPASVWSDR